MERHPGKYGAAGGVFIRGPHLIELQMKNYKWKIGVVLGNLVS